MSETFSWESAVQVRSRYNPGLFRALLVALPWHRFVRYPGARSTLGVLLYGPNRVDAVPGEPQEPEIARTGSSRPRTTPPTPTTPE